MNEAFLDNTRRHELFDVSRLPPALRHAYNPAIFDFGGKRWAFVRTGAFRTSATHLLRVEGRALEYVREVRYRLPWWRFGDALEDIRFFMHGGRPHISHTYSKTSWIAGWFRPEVRKLFVLKLTGKKHSIGLQAINRCCMGYSLLDDELRVGPVTVFPEFPNKNWQFFSSEGSLYAVHGIEPEHTVIQVEQDRIVKTWKTPTPPIFDSKFGHLRGGTPPILFDGKYWSFFHSTLKGASGAYYFCGLYTFESRPPFRIVEMTAVPLMLPPDNADDLANLPSPGLAHSFVVYPIGAVREGESIRLSYGINDTRMAQKLYSFGELQKLLVRAAPNITS